MHFMQGKNMVKDLRFHVYIGVDMVTESQCGYIHAYSSVGITL
jgi:hypothetical protein